jgi:hypothetical protein
MNYSIYMNDIKILSHYFFNNDSSYFYGWFFLLH